MNGRVPGCWAEAEAEENAADLCDYLRRVLWRMKVSPSLQDAVERFEHCVIEIGQCHCEHADIQYLRRPLVRLELKGILRRGLPDYELALDRLEAIERGSFGPLHRAWLLDAAEAAELLRIGNEFDPEPEFDFVSAVSFRCDCVQAMVFVVVHDGQISEPELTAICRAGCIHDCPTMRVVNPVNFGECHTEPGGIDGVVTRMMGQLLSHGLPICGPLLLRGRRLVKWVPAAIGKVAS